MTSRGLKFDELPEKLKPRVVTRLGRSKMSGQSSIMQVLNEIDA